jgi:hypothetical protein
LNSSVVISLKPAEFGIVLIIIVDTGWLAEMSRRRKEDGEGEGEEIDCSGAKPH